MKEASFVIDSGAASSHCKILELFDEYSERRSEVLTADGTINESLATGSIAGINNIKYTPSFTENILSVTQLLTQGYSVVFTPKDSFITKSGICDFDDKINFQLRNGLFYLGKEELERLNNPERCYLNSTKLASSLVTWHQRTHLSDDLLIKLSKGYASGIEINDEIVAHKLSLCEDCALTKPEKNNRKRRLKRPIPKQNLEQIDSDIKVVNIPGFGHEIYILSFRCIRSKFTWIYFLKHKNDAAEALSLFNINVLNQLKEDKKIPTEINLKRLHSDGGGEYFGIFERKCEEFQIKHTLSPPYRPDLNSFAESYWRILMQTTRAFLSHSKLPTYLWTYACSYANYILNRTLLRPIEDTLKTSYEILFNEKPDLSEIKTWGTECYSFIPEEKRNNKSLSNRGLIGNFMGFADNYVHSINIYESQTRTINPHKIEDVIFNEIIRQRIHVDTEENVPIIVEENSAIQETNEKENESEEIERNDKRKKRKFEEINPQEPRRSERIGGKRVKVYSIQNPITKLSEQELAIIRKAENGNQLTPETILEWLEAIEKEKTSLKLNDVYEVVKRPYNRRTLQTVWILSKKFDESGTELKKKARNVLLGNHTQEGLDYNETFSPVAKLSTLRLFLALCIQFNMFLTQGDFNTAFLNASIEEEILIEFPKFFKPEELLNTIPKDSQLRNQPVENLCIKLKKSQYGLKQSSRNWFQTINNFIQNLRFFPYDFILASTNVHFSNRIVSTIQTRFKIKVMGIPKTILGISVIKRDGEILIHQRKKIEDLAKEYKLTESKPVNSPLDGDHKLRKIMSTNKDKQSKYSSLNDEEIQLMYRSIVGKLNHISQATRPDIAYSVATLSKYLNQPSISHIYAAKRVIKYLYHSRFLCIRYKRDENHPLELTSYSDSDWGGDQDNRRSHSGTILMFAKGPIHWTSAVQHTVALSSAEAEIIALKQTTRETLWMRNLIQETYITQVKPITVYEDNSSTIKIVTNPMISKQNRHMEINYYFIMIHIEIGSIQVNKIEGEENIADILTKYYKDNIHKRFICQMFVEHE
eukprot:gene11505-12542_t